MLRILVLDHLQLHRGKVVDLRDVGHLILLVTVGWSVGAVLRRGIRARCLPRVLSLILLLHLLLLLMLLLRAARCVVRIAPTAWRHITAG